MADYYTILGIDRQADKQTIRQAYKRLAVKYHPDKNPGNPASEEIFKMVNEAYQILINDDKKYIYDLKLQGINQVTNNSTPNSYTQYHPRDAEYFRKRKRYQESTKQYNEKVEKHNRKMTIYGLSIFVLFLSIISIISYYAYHKDIDTHYKNGMEYMTAKKYNYAFSEFNDVLIKDNEHIPSLYQIGLIQLYHWKNYERAMYFFDEVISLSEEPTYEMYLQRAISNYYLSDYSKSLADLDVVIQGKNNLGEAYFIRGAVYKKTSDSTKSCYEWMQSYKYGKSEALDSLHTYCKR